MSSVTISNPVATYVVASDNVTLTNLSTIGTATTAVVVNGNADTVVNHGKIDGASYGVSATTGVIITNSGAGAVIYGKAYAIDAGGTSASTIINFASIGGGGGLRLAYTSYVTNEAGGTITGKYDAVIVNGGTVLNIGSAGVFGDITGGFYGIVGSAETVINSGEITGGIEGIQLKVSGSVANLTGGTISGSRGVDVAGGSVLNNGSVYGGSFGVEIKGSGATLTNQSGGTISSPSEGVYDGQGARVLNDGLISTPTIGNDDGIFIKSAYLTNFSDGTIEGSYGIDLDATGSIVNFGTIAGGVHEGVDLFEGGALTNQSGGTISGVYGILASGTASIVNYGGISGILGGVNLAQGGLTNQSGGVILGGTNGYGARLSSNATLLNAGDITATTGLYLQGGYGTNQSGGTISGTDGAKLALAATLTNGGVIAGSTTGIVLFGTGNVINLPGGTIAGGVSAGVAIIGVPNIYYNPFTSQTYFEGYLPGRGLVTNSGLISGAYGVRARYVSATVVNKGTIDGVTAAVRLPAYYPGKVVMYPGAVFNGLVEGGNGALELASSATKGTIAGVGTQFTGFSSVTIDPGAYWTFTSGDTFTGGVELMIAGTLGGALALSAGFTQIVEVQPGASIVGTIDGGNTVGSTVSSELELLSGATAGTLTGIGSNLVNFSDIVVNAGADWLFNPNTFASGTTLNNSGTIGATGGVSVVFLSGAGNRVEIGYGAQFLGTVDGGNPIGSAFASVLELNGTGSTLSGLGSKYINFAQLIVDSGASEYLTADNFAAGMTVTNAGTMSGPGNTAVVFALGSGNRVILAPGGEFVGTVDGGNALGSGTVSTLELTTGSGTGTLTGLGTQFVSFAQITVDPGAYWSLSGNNTIAPGATLTVSGDLNNYGSLYGNVTLAGGVMLNDGPLNGNVTLAGGTMLNNLSGTVTGEVLGVGAAATLANHGTIDGSGGTAVQLAAGFANRVTVFPSAVFGGVVNGNAPGLASLYLGSGSSAGTLVGFGTKYIGFDQITVTSGADWSLGNTTTLAAGITLTNDGTVFGTPDAVRFAPGAGNRVVLEGDGKFVGTVDGGNAVGSPNISTLELGAGGFDTGTVSGIGIGSQFIDFGQINVDYGGSWVFTTGLNTLASGVVLNVAGDLDIHGRVVGNVTLSGGRLEVDHGYSVTGSVIGVATSASVLDYGALKGVGLAAVSLAEGGVVNLGTAAAGINGATYGVMISGASGTVINSGYLVGTKVGVALGAGGTVADYGFLNGGKTSGGVAVWLQSGGGTARIAAGYSITGFIGLRADGPSTVINQGIINGETGGAAVQFGVGANQRLVIDPGAIFRGTVDGGNTAGSTTFSTLELASSAATGTLSGLGSKYINFGSIVVDTNADWLLSGSNTVASGSVLTLTDASLSDDGTLVNNGGVVLTPLANLEVGGLLGIGTTTIVGRSDVYVQGTLGAGETIAFSGAAGELQLASPDSIAGTITNLGFDEVDLFGVNPASVSYSGGELHFTLPGGVGTGSIALTPAPGYAVGPAISDALGTGAAIYANSILCFGAGTHIATPKGEVPVEQLAVNDLVLTSDGAIQPIVWIGTGRVMVPPGRRSAATPVIVRRSALARDVPHRDLYLTKGHSLCIDDVLIPVEFLVNHRSIVWDDQSREITIYHIELARHAVLLAEGAPAESYRDDGNRWLFENANSGWHLPPQEPCLPVLTGGPVVDAVWWRLLHRAGPGMLPHTINDSDLHLVVDGQRVDDEGRTDGLHVFRLSGPPQSVRIVSRSGAPDVLGTARDPRQLGVALRKVVLWQGWRLTVLEANDPALGRGFHEFEPAEGLRWTDGDAVLPASLFAGFNGPLLLELHVAMTTRYPVDRATRTPA